MKHRRHKQDKQMDKGQADYGGKSRKTIAKATIESLAGVGDSPRTTQGNPHTGMGVGSGKGQNPDELTTAGSFAAGRARTNKGKNQTGRGPQGMHG